MNFVPASSVAPNRPRSSAGWRFGGSLLVVVCLGVFGCQRAPSPETRAASSHAPSKPRVNDELMHHALNALYRLEEFEGGEMLQRTIDRLDQWLKDQKPIDGWKPDPLLATLPAELADLPVLKELDQFRFQARDGLALQEAVCLRDVSNWAKGGDANPLARAQALFDWTVRNLQIEPNRSNGPASEHILQTPWETLLLGRGTAWERAWVFVLLARQQGLDAVVLALADPAAPETPTPWVVAVLHEGQLYLFEPTLGLPIPGPDGIRLDEEGQLSIQPATLAQVVADPKLLRQLDLDAEHPYPVKAEQLTHLVALLEASPAYLQEKMAIVEAHLAGAEKMVLTAAPSAQAERVKATQQIQEVRLWTLPLDLLMQGRTRREEVVQWQQVAFAPLQLGPPPVLWKGRALHLKGAFSEEQNAPTYYQMARPSNRELDSANVAAPVKELLLLRKLHASYWLGLIAQHQANYPSAIDYLSKRTLLVGENGPWSRGARYNLGRIYEAQRQYAKAAESYRIEKQAPDTHGNLLRARWLETVAATAPAVPGDEPPKPAAEKALPALPTLHTLPTLPEEPAAEKTEPAAPK